MLPLIFAASKVEPIAVEVVGGDGKFLHVLLALGGSAFVATAAIFAAIVAARTANQRQRAQLDHDSEVRRREHIRDALDTAAERLYEAFEALAVYELRIEEGEKARAALKKARDHEATSPDDLDQAKTLVDHIHDQIEEAIQQSASQLLAVQASEFQLKLRIGNDHPIVKAYERAKLGFAEIRKALDNGRIRDRTDGEKSTYEEVDKESATAYSDFLDASEVWNSGTVKAAEQSKAG
jgi:hypothetical protein